jgi:hypothetical protein
MGDKVQVTVIATGFMGQNIIAREAAEPEHTGKNKEFIDYEEFKSFTDHSSSPAASDFLNPRSSNYRDDDLEVPTVLRRKEA